MRDDCWLQNRNIERELEAYFDEVDREVSRYYEENPQVAEPQLDGRLAALIDTRDQRKFDVHQRRINDERIRDGRGALTFSVGIKHITSSERRLGADIGLVAQLNCPGEYRLTKGVIVQSKRLAPVGSRFSENCCYEQLKFEENTTLRPQWKRMLDFTPASVYFLYNPEKLRMRRNIQRVGIRVIDARVIEGLWASGRRSPLTVLELYRLSRPFASWMVEQFICCGTGDSRDDVVHAASGENLEFPVRYSITVTLKGDRDARPDLFARPHE